MSDLKSEDAVAQNAAQPSVQTSSPPVEEQSTTVQTSQPEAPEERVPDEVPETEEERRKAFQEMRQEIKRLKEERQVRTKSESVFNALRPKADVANAELRVEDFTDPVTGEVNHPAYNAAMRAEQARLAAVQANQSVQEQLDEYQARSKYPELFADPEIEEEIASRWLFNKYQGKSITVSDIAASVAKKYNKAVSKAEKSATEKVLTEVTAKEQAALQPSTQNSTPAKRASSQEELEGLRNATRYGGSDGEMAIAARLRSIPWANK